MYRLQKVYFVFQFFQFLCKLFFYKLLQINRIFFKLSLMQPTLANRGKLRI